MIIMRMEKIDKEEPPILGVLGGMGPAATADFLAKLAMATPVRCDQEHIATITCSLPAIPDRTAAILHGGASPLPAMRAGVRLLERCGVSHMAVPCNTAHHWFDELQGFTLRPILHIVDATAHTLRKSGLQRGTVGLLATTATIQSGTYARRLERNGFECLFPDASEQLRVMQVILAVKEGHIDSRSVLLLQRIGDSLRQRGAQTIILGCTELPLVLSQSMHGFVDSTAALAHACVRKLTAEASKKKT